MTNGKALSTRSFLFVLVAAGCVLWMCGMIDVAGHTAMAVEPNADAVADAWPTFRKDVGRSGYVATQLNAPRLQQRWKWSSPSLPQPAWDGPARWDAFASIRDLPAMRSYDTCFHPTSDGRKVYLGSSSQDTLFALDLEDGKQVWSFTAGGPIRLAPTLDSDCVYFGCDDGFAYCLDASTGKLIWRFSPSEHAGATSRGVLNNDRLISFYPVRTGVCVRDGIACFAASLLPWRESFLCGVDASTGKIGSKGTFSVQHDNATLEGSMLIAGDRLIVPQGRIAPLLFKRGSGEKIGSLPGGGGVTIVLTETGDVVRAEGGKDARPGQIGVFRGEERVASFPRGRALVVRPESYYVIDQDKLFSADRTGNRLRWQRSVDEPVEIIMAGDTLFIGGRDHVTAVDGGDGKVTWSASVEGRAAGLAIAGDRLIVSTDAGNLYCFAPTSERPWSSKTRHDQAADASWKSPPVARVRNRDLLHRWVFHRSAMKKDGEDTPVSKRIVKNITVLDQAGDCRATLSGGPAEVLRIGDSDRVEAIQLKDSFFSLSQESAQALPVDAITVSAWVRVDQAAEWGGIIGCIQDDGSTEHGWLLGFRNDKFCMAVAGQGGGLTYLTSKKPFQLKRWNHVVGTYNGREIRLYVNGSLAASSQAESGPISYAPERIFTLAAYKDVNESYPLVGALQEVRIYNSALGASSIRRLAAARARDFDVPAVSEQDNRFLAWGPVARFLRPGVAEVTFGTTSSLKTAVRLITDQGVRDFDELQAGTEHSILVDDLPARRELQFQIRRSVLKSGLNESVSSSSFVLDTHFDWTMPAATRQASWTQSLVSRAPNSRGVAVLVGARWADRAIELAQSTRFSVVLLVPGQKQAQSIRNDWLASGLPYGAELSVVNRRIKDLPGAFATVVISLDDTPAVRRLVRPDGGILSNGQSILWQREPLLGIGQWSHMYGDSNNSAFGGETMGGATRREDLVTQWIGRPGPRYQTDRQNRKPSPLATGGRLYLQGQQRIIGLDAYSGSVLWTVETPTVMRWNVPHDCANWCADQQGLFVAASDRVWAIDGKTGQIVKQYVLPRMKAPQEGTHAWGFIAKEDSQLIGSAVLSTAIYTDWWSGKNWFDSTGGPDTHVVAGDSLFAVDLETGKTNWKYDGLILHPTITLMDGQAFFVEDLTVAHQQSTARRISLGQDQKYRLVCLDLKTGDVKWEKPLSPFGGHIASLYLVGGGGVDQQLILAASEVYRKAFAVQQISPESGEFGWQRSVAWEADNHGKHIAHPAIQGSLLYLRPEVLNVATGATLVRGFPSGHGCTSYTLASSGLIGRLGTVTWWDPRTKTVSRFPRLRTDCWISTIPAQGMLLSPEGGGGCSCGSWFETSIGFLPRVVDEEVPE